MTKKFSILFLFAMVATYGTFYIADNVNRQPASTPIDASTKPVDLSNQPAAKKSFLAAHYTVPDMTTYHQQESFKYAVRSKELNDRLIQAQNDLSKINVNTNPKNQANKIAEKKDGTLIPNVLITAIILSKKVSLYKADKIPKTIPNSNAITIAKIAKTAVFGNVSAITSDTFFPFF